MAGGFEFQQWKISGEARQASIWILDENTWWKPICSSRPTGIITMCVASVCVCWYGCNPVRLGFIHHHGSSDAAANMVHLRLSEVLFFLLWEIWADCRKLRCFLNTCLLSCTCIYTPWCSFNHVFSFLPWIVITCICLVPVGTCREDTTLQTETRLLGASCVLLQLGSSERAAGWVAAFHPTSH